MLVSKRRLFDARKKGLRAQNDRFVFFGVRPHSPLKQPTGPAVTLGMIRECAWHPQHFGSTLRVGTEGPVTHTICDDCYRREFGEDPPPELAPFGLGLAGAAGDAASGGAPDSGA